MQSDESWLSKAMLRYSLTSRMQRYNMHTPESKFFRNLISHPDFFSSSKNVLVPFIYGHFEAFFAHKKNEIGIYFYSSFHTPTGTKKP